MFAYVDDIEDIPKRPIDEDRAAFLQGFVDFDLLDDGDWQARIGRQLIALGAGRLVDTRWGPNVLRSFDSAQVSGTIGRWDMRTFYSQVVENRFGEFDNATSGHEEFYGTYWTCPNLLLHSGSDDFKNGNQSVQSNNVAGIDAYYLGYRIAIALFDAGPGAESRHTLGTRLFGTRGS